MQTISQINLDIIGAQAPPRVYAKQYDEAGRWIYATITENGEDYSIPAGAYAVFGAAKPDGTYVFYDSDELNDTAVFIDGSVVQVSLVAAVLNVAGTVDAQISLYSADGEKITTLTFFIEVQKSTVPDNAVSTTYVNALTALVADAVAAQNAAEDAADAATSLVTDSVRVDLVQTFTSAQQQQGRENINAEEAGVVKPITEGGTGATTAATALQNLGAVPSAFSPTGTGCFYLGGVNSQSWYSGLGTKSTYNFLNGMPSGSMGVFYISGSGILTDQPSNYMQFIAIKGSNMNYAQCWGISISSANPSAWIYGASSSTQTGAWKSISVS